ncbi:MAG: (2Fe-2S)-binding protein [Actinobacteria bacterium]|nr:(2Fe-2S)-binding protein [Actinomycetota bacterium]MBU1943737.1 (2Fe-2S)-binding protein [Actinomycetota bacterium]MBU2687072.1 (2Fe-2S)-binding protein [Actinomycetota bacterium]
MVNLVIDGQRVDAEEGWTILDAARYYGVEIPTLCHMDGLTPYSACRLCVVEVRRGERSRMVASCSCPVEVGMEVVTKSDRVKKARRMIIELMLATTPNSRTLQCLASEHGVTEVRFRGEDRRCILCGLCIRICDQQMRGGAIGFSQRGVDRTVSLPFHKTPEACRQCGACMYVCPVCELPCPGTLQPGELCNNCLNVVEIDAFPSAK